MPSPSVTYTLSNGSVADAAQINQNYTDIINALSDGTKDLSVSALTAAGNVSFTGSSITLGNASSDDLTITASLASTINIKTTNSYNIGSSTLGLAGIYFGANSQTVRIVASGSMSATWTLTLPVSAGTSGYALTTNGSGVTSWTNYKAGITDGSAVTAGNIGEVIQSTFSNVTIATGAVRSTGANVVLTAGCWWITATMHMNGSSANEGIQMYISTTDASSSGTTQGTSYVVMGGTKGTGLSSASITGYFVNISSQTTYYLNATALTADGTVWGSIQGLRIR